jgi:hypothetical protein
MSKKHRISPKDAPSTLLFLYLKVARYNKKKAMKDKKRVVKIEKEIGKMRPKTLVPEEVFSSLMSQRVLLKRLSKEHFDSIDWKDGITIECLVDRVWKKKVKK